MFENTESGNFAVDYVISDNDGVTWYGRGRVYTAVDGKAAGAPYVQNVTGTIVVSFMSNEYVQTASNSQVDGGQMRVVTNDGRDLTKWQGPFLTAGGGTHWPSLFIQDAAHFLALYRNDQLGAVSQSFELRGVSVR